MRTDITQTYHRHKRKGGTKSKRRRGRASERERARERKVDRKTDRQTDRERKETQPDRQGQNSVCAGRSPSEKHTRLSQKHTRLCVVWGAIHGVVVIFGASAGLVSRYISRLPHSNFATRGMQVNSELELTDEAMAQRPVRRAPAKMTCDAPPRARPSTTRSKRNTYRARNLLEYPVQGRFAVHPDAGRCGRHSQNMTGRCWGKQVARAWRGR